MTDVCVSKETEEQGTTEAAFVVSNTSMDTADEEGVSHPTTGQGDRDVRGVPVKFENASKAEMNSSMNSPVSDAVNAINGTVTSCRTAATQAQSPSQLPAKGTRRSTRKPQFTQRIWRLDIVGVAFDRWRRIGASKGLCSDTEIASFLMQHYEDTLSGFQSAVQCSLCQAPLTLTCADCNPVSDHTTVQPQQVNHMTSPVQSGVGDGKDCGGEIRMEEFVDENDDDSFDDKKKDKDFRITVKLPQGRKRKRCKGRRRQRPPVNLPKRQHMQETSAQPSAPANSTTSGEEPEEHEDPSDHMSYGSTPLRRHICAECGAMFTRAGGLKVHMRIHTGEKPYKCDECGMAFNQTVSLIVHKRKHSGERPYACSECGATFPLASTLKQHARIHSGERPYTCSHCPKTFSRSGDLTSHMRVHTGLKPFLCQECGKRFASSSDLTKHKRTHTGDKPFECPECHKKFPFPHRLTAHMRSHTGDKPYLCTVCGAAFARASNLTVHFRIHTGDKPFECEECGKRFSDSGNLCKHRRTSHGGSGKKLDKGQSSEMPVDGASFPSSADFPGLPLPNQQTLSQGVTVPSQSLPVFARNAALFPPYGAEENESVPRGTDTHNPDYSSVNEAALSLRTAATTSTEREDDFSSSSNRDSSFEEGNKATTPAHGEEGKTGQSGFMFKCEDCPATFGDPELLAKHWQLLHSSIDMAFVAVGNVEQRHQPTSSYNSVRNNSVGDEHASMLPCFSATTLGYYYQQ